MFFKVIIKNESSDKVAISSDKVEISSDKASSNEYKFQVNNSESKVINYLKKNESITNKEAREVTGLSSSGVRKVFDGLIQKKINNCFWR